MRRGLKPRNAAAQIVSLRRSFKPIPDEEGTETLIRQGVGLVAERQGFKPIPDEEGTETAPMAVHRHA